MIRTNRLKLIACVGLIIISCGKGLEKQAQEFMELGMFDEAKTFLAEELSKRPKNAELHFLLGKCFLETDELEKAEESFGRATSLTPTISVKIGKTYSEKALTLLRIDEIDKPLSFFATAMNYDSSLKPVIVDALTDSGKVLITTNYYWDAIQLLSASVNYDPSLKEEIASILFNGGKIFIKRGVSKGNNFRIVRNLFMSAFKYDPEMKTEAAKFCIEQAQNAFIEGDDSEFLFSLASEINPDAKLQIANIYFNEAKAKLKEGDNPEGLFSGASRYNPDLKSKIASIYFAEAKAKLQERKRRKALKLFNLVLKYDLDKKLDIEKTKADAGVLRAIAGGLSFEILGVWRSESSLILNLMITNTRKSGKQLSIMSKTRIVDSAGQEYTVSEIILGAPAPPTPGKKSDRTAVYHYPLHSRKQVETWLSFKSVPESAKSISLLEIDCSTLPVGVIAGFPNRFRARLRDIPIPQ